MSLDRGLGLAFACYSTLWLLVVTITLPLHLVHGFVYRDVIALSDLHPEIVELDPELAVGGVSAADLRDARRALLSVNWLELALTPLLIAAARRALEVEVEGGVPTIADSWRGLRRRHLTSGIGLRGAGAALIALLVSVAIGLGIDELGRLLAEPLPPDLLWLAGALVDVLARALAAPFFLATVAPSTTLGPRPRAGQARVGRI